MHEAASIHANVHMNILYTVLRGVGVQPERKTLLDG
jgi:hypothetical protein